MKREELRKVEFSNSIDGGYTYQTYTGYFHCWGLESVETLSDSENDYVSNYSVAIIEEQDGNIITVAPRFVRFL